MKQDILNIDDLEAITAAQGGKFRHGFFAGAFTAGLAPEIMKNFNTTGGRVLASSVIGGTASVLGGGKFANGAITGAFVMLFNHMQHQKEESVEITPEMIEQAMANLPSGGTVGQYMSEAIKLLAEYPNAYVTGETIKSMVGTPDEISSVILSKLSKITKTGDVLKLIITDNISVEIPNVPILNTINLKINTNNSIYIKSATKNLIHLDINGIKAGVMGVNQAKITQQSVSIKLGLAWVSDIIKF